MELFLAGKKKDYPTLPKITKKKKKKIQVSRNIT